MPSLPAPAAAVTASRPFDQAAAAAILAPYLDPAEVNDRLAAAAAEDVNPIVLDAIFADAIETAVLDELADDHEAWSRAFDDVDPDSYRFLGY